MHRELGLFRWLLDYELRSCERYRRFVSIVLISHEGAGRFRDVCGDVLRNSDQLVDFGFCSALVMGETDTGGALQAVGRFKRRYGHTLDIRYAVVGYPSDGLTAEDLLAMGESRLSDAKRLESGAVVSRSSN